MSQHDFTIANQTASNARTDINNAFQALVSNNSGAAAPSTTYANMFWYETDTNTFKMRNEADSAWITWFTIDQSNSRINKIEATDFNTVSDYKFKQDIVTYPDALQTINAMRGVSFEWKHDNSKSAGVIAQELEEVMPELVHTNEEGNKSVTYIGIIGVLIEAVKELSDRIEDLENGI